MRADDGAQVSEHVLPALMKVGGGGLAADLMVLNFGLHFNTQSRAQQYLWHIDAVLKFVEGHKVSLEAQDVSRRYGCTLRFSTNASPQREHCQLRPSPALG